MFEKIYSAGEARLLSSLLLEEYTGLGRARQLAAANESVADNKLEEIIKAAERVSMGEPWQYVIGYTTFCDKKIIVNPAVLIPRPETEELTSIIIAENTGFAGIVIDYCTGSGCIAVSLASALPQADIHATDISYEALSVAKENAALNNVTVQFHHSDIMLDNILADTKAGIIVSNPPYVREKEKAVMGRNVIAFEPHGALFVPDNDPLRFYKRLAALGTSTLIAGGRIYLEINEELGEETASLFPDEIFRDVSLLRDLFGRIRFIKAIRR